MKQLSILFLALAAFLWFPPGASAQADCPSGKTLTIVAHPNDDLLFINPHISRDIKRGLCVRTVYLSAGDGDKGEEYWTGLEKGEKAAYAKMAGGANSWIQTDAGVANHPLPVFTLSGKPKVSLLFMRLPDGDLYGQGFRGHKNESLLKVWSGSLPSISALDASSSYTRTDIITTLIALMSFYQPTKIYTHGYSDSNGQDPSDHNITAYFARAAHKLYTKPHTFIGYRGNDLSSQPANLSSADKKAKTDIFLTYAASDSVVCRTAAACANPPYGIFLSRMHTAGSEKNGSQNIALISTVTASLEAIINDQRAIKVIDNFTDGYPGNYTHEWTTSGGKGSWLNLQWPNAQKVGKIVLYDRPNLDDNITSGTITFSDGTSIQTGKLNNNGSATPLTFPPKTVTSLRLTITGISPTSYNIGLAEIQVYPQ